MKEIKTTAEFLALSEEEIIAALDAYEEEADEDEQEDGDNIPDDRNSRIFLDNNHISSNNFEASSTD